MSPRVGPELVRWSPSARVLSVCIVSFLLFWIIQLVVPFWGTFAVGTALAYVATDAILGAMVQFGRGNLKLFGSNLFGSRAQGFVTFLTFVLILSPLVSWGAELEIPALSHALPYPTVLVAGLLAFLAVLALWADFTRQL